MRCVEPLGVRMRTNTWLEGWFRLRWLAWWTIKIPKNSMMDRREMEDDNITAMVEDNGIALSCYE